MQPQFWLDKWQKQETGFHNQRPHRLLVSLRESVFSRQHSIFVPLCGKSQDLIYLADNGHQVVGCELSPLAIESFAKEQSLDFNKSQQDDFIRYQNTEMRLYAGDYFDLNDEQVGRATGIYDRAALIALPLEMRKRYVEKLHQLCPSATLLLITLEYPQEKMQGPPFSVDTAEVERLFAFARVEKCYFEDRLAQEPKFKSRGLNKLVECAYVIRW